MATFILFVLTCAVIPLCQTTPNSPEYYLSLFRRLQIRYQFINFVLQVCCRLIVLILQAGAFRKGLFNPY